MYKQDKQDKNKSMPLEPVTVCLVVFKQNYSTADVRASTPILFSRSTMRVLLASRINQHPSPPHSAHLFLLAVFRTPGKLGLDHEARGRVNDFLAVGR